VEKRKGENQGAAFVANGDHQAFPGIRQCSRCRVDVGVVVPGRLFLRQRPFLSEQTGIDTKNIDRALTILERAGVIIRGTVLKGEDKERRIWPCKAIVERMRAETEVAHTPKIGGIDTPKIWGIEHSSKAQNPKRAALSTQQAARLDAERREQRQQNKGDAGA
jgi:hypothetical protein